MSLTTNYNPQIQFSFAGLPADYCFVNPNRFALDIVAQMTGFIIGGFVGIIAQEATPSVSDRDKLWWKLDSSQGPATPPGPYQYVGGYWIYPNPEPPDSPVRRFVECAEADVWSYDGGDGTDPTTNPPTINTGAMWEVDTAYSARMAIAAGTLSPSGDVIAVGDTGGADEITQTSAQMPVHTHNLNGIFSDANSNTSGLGTIGQDQSVYDTYEAAGRTFTNADGSAIENTGGTGTPAVTQPMTVISPYRAGYYIMRTVRANYVG